MVAECDYDFTRLLRFPCDNSTCEVDMTGPTLDCGGLTSEDYALAPNLESSRLSISYTCIPNGENIGKLGELNKWPQAGGDFASDLPDNKWSTGVRRAKKDFRPSYESKVNW